MSEFVNLLIEKGLDTTQAKQVEERLLAVDKDDYQTLKNLLNSYPHPSSSKVNDYKINSNNKVLVKDIDYGGIDDLICGTINNLRKDTDPEIAYKRLIPYLNAILNFEEEEQKHTHKGAIYFNIGQGLFKKGNVENALYFIHRGLIEDDMKHVGIEIFPRVWSYQLIILDKKFSHPYINDMIKFLTTYILKSNYNYNDIFNKFLNLPSLEKSNNLKWLDHVAFFHFLLLQLKKRIKFPEDIFDSVLGNLISSNIIGELCLLIESICKLKLESKGIKGLNVYNDIYPVLKKKYTWTGTFRNIDFDESNLSNTLIDIFNNSYRGSTNQFENSFYLSWGLRNKVHHKVDTISLLRDNFNKIIEKQMEFFLEFIIH